MYGDSRRRYYRQDGTATRPPALPPLEVYDILDSTMDIEPPTLPYVAAALTQRRGRGRTGAWASPRGGAWLTVFLNVQPKAQLPVAVGGCIAARLERLVGVRLGVKWPNDILYGAAKLAGVLVEYRGGILRVGVGVNVHNEPPEGAVSLAALGYQGAIARVYVEVVSAVLEAVEDTRYCMRRARERDILQGCKVKVDAGGEIVEGVAEGIGDDGGLRVEGKTLYCCHILSYHCSQQPHSTSPAR